MWSEHTFGSSFLERELFKTGKSQEIARQVPVCFLDMSTSVGRNNDFDPIVYMAHSPRLSSKAQRTRFMKKKKHALHEDN